MRLALRLHHGLRLRLRLHHRLRLRLRLDLRLRLAAPVPDTLIPRLRLTLPQALALPRKLRLRPRLGQTAPDALALRRKLRLCPGLGLAAPDALALRRKLRLRPRLGLAAPDALALRRKLRLRRAVPDPAILGLDRHLALAPRLAGRNGTRRVLPPVDLMPRIWLLFADDDDLPAPVVQVEEPRALPRPPPVPVEVVIIKPGMDVVIDHHIRVVIVLVVGWRVGCRRVNNRRSRVGMIGTTRYARQQRDGRCARHQSNKFPSFHDRISNVAPAECSTANNAGLRPWINALALQIGAAISAIGMLHQTASAPDITS
ncbi:MAG: hypothetical protein OEN55_02775 [Alphaproteobacteria bacterium]|nr:hypothetical protein [Alphaproteobacteria bacterium]